ncbi:MAG: hypothetical protein AAGJ81_07265 [Verrucomicrobiota bacterium]
MTEKNNEAPQDDVPPEVKRKADRAIWILYIVMAILILLPFLMLLAR